MNKENKQFYLVDFAILPTAIKKTIRAKELLKNGTAETINAAVVKTGISRSAYYKYKDHVAPAFDDTENGTMTFFIVLQNDPAVANKILRKCAKENVEILTMNRGIPVKKLVTLTLTVKTSDMQITQQTLTEDLQNIKGVKKIYSVGED